MRIGLVSLTYPGHKSQNSTFSTGGAAVDRVTLEIELEQARGEASLLREWIQHNVPTAGILEQPHLGREYLDRLHLAESSVNETLVDGLFELRDGLKIALGYFDLKRQTSGTFAHLKGLINRWGDVHLGLVRKGVINGGREGCSGQGEEGQSSKGSRGGCDREGEPDPRDPTRPGTSKSS